MSGRLLAAMSALVLALTACGESAPATTAPRERTPITTTLSPEALATSTTAPPVDVPGGFLLYKGDGFELFMPKTFTIAGAGDFDLDRVLRELNNDQIERTVRDAFESGGKMVAFDFGNSTEDFVNNVNILKLPLPPLSGEDLAAATQKDFSRIGASNIESRVERLPAGEAIVVSYTLPLDLGGAQGVSYTVLTPTSQWVVTYSASNMRPFIERFEVMMDSFTER